FIALARLLSAPSIAMMLSTQAIWLAVAHKALCATAIASSHHQEKAPVLTTGALLVIGES
ncbi:MAG: hypothetical protein AAFY67_21160, partial [Cyanobacteria bacterium J06642_9]